MVDNSSILTGSYEERKRRDSIFYICTTLRKIGDILVQKDHASTTILSKSEMEYLDRVKGLFEEFSIHLSYSDIFSSELSNDFDFWAAPYIRKVPVFEALNLKKCEEDTHKILLRLSSNNFFKKELSREKFVDHIYNLVEQNILKFENWESNILQILGNISTIEAEESYVHFSELTEWCDKMASRTESSIFIEAWRALWNLKGAKPIYLDGIYPLVPPWETEKPEFDIVLVHGIKGGASYTWRQLDSEKFKDHLTQHQRKLIYVNKKNGVNGNQVDESQNYSWIWPLDWMSHDLKLNARIIALNYHSDWWDFGKDTFEEKDFESISREFLPKLRLAEVGSRPIVWIGHSMGGIIIKKLLEDSEMDKENGALPSLASSTSAVIFMAVPHFGSFFASCSCIFEPLLRPSILLRQIKAGNPRLKSLNDSFVSMCEQNSVKVLTLAESRPSKITPLGPSVVMLPDSQADAGIGKLYTVDASHLDICKPKNRSSQIYAIIRKFLEDVCSDIIAKMK